MSPSIFARLVQVCWAFFRSIFYSRRRKHLSSPELPTVATNAFETNYETDSLRSWQKDKQQFLRRPSLQRASTRETQKKRHRALAPPPPEIYVEDWSSLGLNMTDFFETPSSVAGRPAAGESGVSVVSTNHSSAVATVPESDSEHLTDDTSSSSGFPPLQPNPSSEHHADDASSSPTPQPNMISEHPTTVLPDAKTKTESSLDPTAGVQEATVVAQSLTLSFSAGRYASSALSAVSGLLWDPPSFDISHSTPLPLSDVTPFLSKPPPQSTLALGLDSMAPYPDVFDFSIYMRRISRDSFCEAIELPPLGLGVKKPSDKSTRPIPERHILVVHIVTRPHIAQTFAPCFDSQSRLGKECS
ncbi:hypothetical protein MVEN_01222900 [Mycena venus]|uniref:Uncharacterized protein n=1 Tax=Mycena venus TaxID=2733690 RepID=A0A8H6Y5H5_9AGAR|nr:hypothetical protein MVEN_01222900 [Mycena venus]